MAVPPTTPPPTLGGLLGGKTPLPGAHFHAPHVAHPTLDVAAVVAAVAAVLIWREWSKRRANQVDRVLATMAAVLGVHGGTGDHHVKKRGGGGKPATRWRHGKLVMVRASYPIHAIAHPKARAEMDRALSDLLGCPVECEWNVRKGTVKMTVAAPVADEDPGTMHQLRAVFAHALEDAKVTAGDHSSDGDLTSFTVDYGPTSSDADEAWRVKIDGVVCSKTARAWVSQWKPAAHQVTYKTRPELPNFVAHPTSLAVDSKRPYLIPIGVAGTGPTTWDLDDQTSPHALAVGTTGSGKSSLLAGLVAGAARLGVEIRIIDGKGDSLSGLKDFPGVTDFEARDHARMIAMLGEVDILRQQRSDSVDDESMRRDDLRHLILVVDEAGQLIRRCETKDDRDEILRRITSLSAAGRSARVHLVLGLHQARADLLGGTEVRGLFAVRVALGRMDRHSRQMLDLHNEVPATPPGRSIVATPDGVEREVQVYWTPSDPRHSLNATDRALMDALTDPAVKQGQSSIMPLPAEMLGNGPVTPLGNAHGNTVGNATGNALPPALPPEQVERIKALRAAGATYRAIADELGISVKAAHKYGSQQLESAARPRLRVVPDDEG